LTSETSLLFFVAVWKSSTPVPCAELDGSNIRDFFTVLNLCQFFTQDQMLNIHMFSLLHAWLSTNFLPFVDGMGKKRKASRVLSEDLKEIIIRYCVRVIDQGELASAIDPTGGKMFDLPLASFRESIIQQSFRAARRLTFGWLMLLCSRLSEFSILSARLIPPL